MKLIDGTLLAVAALTFDIRRFDTPARVVRLVFRR
jgi:hypothetical protein